MKMRLLPTLVGLAIGFAVPVLAQEQNTVDPEVRQQIEASIMKADKAFNRSDAAGCTAEYTQDAIAQLPVGTLLLFSGFLFPHWRIPRQNRLLSTPWGILVSTPVDA
jgi:hypothetical protein